MLLSFTRNFIIAFLVAIGLGLISCSSDAPESELPEKEATPDTTATTEGRVSIASDTAPLPERITMVVGAEPSAEPESLLAIDPATFAGWKSATHQNVKLLCPPTHAHASDISGLAKSFSQAMTSACQFFGITVPAKQVVVLYYTGPGQAKEITGMNYAFYSGDTLHFWPPNYFGSPIVKYLLPKWQNITPRHQFLRHGLIALLDNSGENYHKRTLLKYQRNEPVSLGLLAVTRSIDSDKERQESAMAASFVDFVTYRYGVNKLAELYRSQEEFSVSAQNVLGVSSDSLQTLWIGLLEEVVPAMDQ